ncbi:MAG: hypothetical protein OEW62_00855 [Candidatus Bathyarchaeota archaeon]|nr:hypothetical protein [Candidatus Bathyarchaeota archaeon]
MNTEIFPWLTFLAGSAFAYAIFWLEGRRYKKQQKREQRLELVKKVYDPLLAEIHENLGSLEKLDTLKKFKPKGERVKWEELGFSTSEWEYVKTSGFYHSLEKDLAKKLHEIYGGFHEIRVWGGDVEGVLRGVEELKMEMKLNVLSKEIKEKIEDLEKSIGV